MTDRETLGRLAEADNAALLCLARAVQQAQLTALSGLQRAQQRGDEESAERWLIRWAYAIQIGASCPHVDLDGPHPGAGLLAELDRLRQRVAALERDDPEEEGPPDV